jgi:hypothetical protein
LKLAAEMFQATAGCRGDEFTVSRTMVSKRIGMLQTGWAFVSDMRVFPKNLLIVRLGVDASFVGNESR